VWGWTENVLLLVFVWQVETENKLGTVIPWRIETENEYEMELE